MKGKRSGAVLASLILLGFAFILFLVGSVVEDLDALSTAQHDDIRWNMSQFEIETQNLDREAHDLANGHADDLRTFRKQFDIYYSRVTTLTQSTFYQTIAQDERARIGLEATTDFLDRVTPIVDGPDAELRAAMPDIRDQIESLRRDARVVALAGIQVFAKAEAVRREELSQTLKHLAASVLGLVVILLLSLAVLVKLFRRGQLVAHDNQVVRSRFEAAVSSSLDAVLVVDIHGRIIEFNGAAEEVFGYTKAEALNADMAELIVPEKLRDMHRKGMARYLETGVQRVIGAGRVKLEGMRKSGEVFPVELSISLSEADGERVFVSFLRDITQDLEAEEQLRTAVAVAQESEKAKSDLLTVMSHEMRTPLNGILGSLSLIDQESLSPQTRRHLNAISVSGDLLLSHVNDVLDLSSLRADTVTQQVGSFDLQDMMSELVQSLSASAQRRGNSLTVDFITDDLRGVTGAKRPLQQCLINLIGNAIKFTKDGAVAVEVERLSDGDLVEIRVSDTGVGMSAEDLEHIFEEFYAIDTTYARENAGTGLGLAITKRLVTAMQGEISADSFPGEGSLFTLCLPLPVDSAFSKSAEPVLYTPQTQSIDRHALVVDDNDINRMILGEMLRDAGLRVTEAADGFEAIKAVADQAFDVLFLDISMPGLDGIETLARIRQLDVAWADVPAISVTAHAARKDHDRIKAASFESVLVKPINPPTVQATLAQVFSADDTPSQDPEEESPAETFRRHFGDARYESAVTELTAEMSQLANALETVAELTTELRESAHKSSGSAAVLGQQEAYDCLQAIEKCDAANWPDDRAMLLDALKRLAS